MRRWMLAILVTIVSLGWTVVGEQILTIAFDAADLKTLDPHFAAATMDRAVVDMVFNGLVRYKPGDITAFEPDLAVSWEVSEDGLVWTFYLRRGVLFHPWNGKPGYELTAEDVVYSLKKAATPGRSAYAAEYTGMEFEVVDPYTVRIKLAAPLSEALFLPKVANYSGGFIICKKAIEEMGDDAFKTHPVGTGPFMFESYIPMDRLVLVKNPNYFRGEPKLDRVIVRYMPSVAAREAGLITGEIDVIVGPPEQPWVEKMKAYPGVIVDTFGPGEIVFISWNMLKEPFTDIRVRQALNYAIDREAIVAGVGPAVAEPLCAPIPPVLAGGMTCEEVRALGLAYDVDRNKAKALLAEAGYPDGFAIEVITSEKAEYLIPTELVQAQLREVGVDLRIRLVDHPTMHTLIRQDVNPLVIYVCWRPNADVFLTHFYYGPSRVVYGEKPITNFSHIDYIDHLIEAARHEVDLAKQIEYWKEAQKVILRDAVAYPLYTKLFVYARRAAVDYGYELKSTLALYPQINELTTKK